MIAMSNDAPNATSAELSPIDLLIFLFRNKLWAIGAGVGLAIVAFMWFETGESLYEATSTCIVADTNPKQMLNSQLCQRLVESTKMANRVGDKLKEKKLLDPKKTPTIRGKIQDARTIIVSGMAETPDLAAAIANEAAIALTETSQSLKTELIDGAQSGYSRELPNLQKQLQTAETNRTNTAADYAKKMQLVYQNWRVENVKTDESALGTASILQKETIELLQAYQSDTFQKIHSLEQALKIDFLRTQVAALSGKASAMKDIPREGYNAAFAAGHAAEFNLTDNSRGSQVLTIWPKSKTGIMKSRKSQGIAEPVQKTNVAVLADTDLQNTTGEYLASLSTDLNALKPEVAFEPVPLENLSRSELAKAVSDLFQAESALRKLQSERELGFIKLRQERAVKLERLKQETQARQRDLLFARDQELAGLRFAQESADELGLAEVTAQREFLNEMAKASNTATIARAENSSSDVQIIDVAMPPSSTMQKPSIKYAAVALVLGAMLGYGLAGLRELSKLSQKRAA